MFGLNRFVSIFHNILKISKFWFCTNILLIIHNLLYVTTIVSKAYMNYDLMISVGEFYCAKTKIREQQQEGI